MERTKPGVVLCSGFFQPDVFANDAGEIRLLFERVREVAGIRHRTKTLEILQQPEAEWNIAGVEKLCILQDSGGTKRKWSG